MADDSLLQKPAFKEGKAARSNGTSVESNPYNDNRWRQWWAGWMTRDAAIRAGWQVPS